MVCISNIKHVLKRRGIICGVQKHKIISHILFGQLFIRGLASTYCEYCSMKCCVFIFPTTHKNHQNLVPSLVLEPAHHTESWLYRQLPLCYRMEKGNLAERWHRIQSGIAIQCTRSNLRAVSWCSMSSQELQADITNCKQLVHRYSGGSVDVTASKQLQQVQW